MGNNQVTAHGKLHNQDIEAEVINPGGWWGRTWLIEIGCGHFSIFYVVEADSVTDAIDEFADSEQGKRQIGIDLESSEADDYGFSVSPGDIIHGEKIKQEGHMTLRGTFVPKGDPRGAYLQEPYCADGGNYCDLDNIMIHGKEGYNVERPWPCEYHVPWIEEPVEPSRYGEPTYNIANRHTGEVVESGFASDMEAVDWLDKQVDKGVYPDGYDFEWVEVPFPEAPNATP